MCKSAFSTLAGVFLLAGLLGAGTPAVHKDVVEKHVKALAATIPSGWTVRMTDDADGIWVERKEGARMFSNAPNPPAARPDESPKFGQPTLLLTIGPARTQAQIATMTKQNADRAKALAMLQTQMVDMLPKVAVMPSGGDEEDYQPSTPEQRAKLDAYVAVKKAMPYQDIPEFFAEDASFRWVWLSLSPAEAQVEAEQERIRLIVESTFSKKPLP